MANGLSVQMLDANRNILAEKCLVAVLEDEQGKRSQLACCEQEGKMGISFKLTVPILLIPGLLLENVFFALFPENFSRKGNVISGGSKSCFQFFRRCFLKLKYQ